MRQLTDHLLVDVYNRAITLKLDQDFIELLALEIRRRNLLEVAAHLLDTTKTA